MPFELGLVVGIVKTNPRARQDTWFVLETVNRRIHKSLSDLNGTEVYVHGGTPNGVFGQLNNAFVRTQRQPTVAQMQIVFEHLKRSARQIKRDSGSPDLYATRVFRDLVSAAQGFADLTVR